jgi:uncharacterized protein
MIHPNTELKFISPEKGYGVVATKRIPKGTITWALDKLDRSFDTDEIRQMDSLHQELLDKYTFRDHLGRFILCWDLAKYVNHSFLSNCITTAYDFEIAVRDIEPGEELTDDYGYLNLTESFIALPEEGSERLAVHPDDLLRYYPIWDKQLKEAFQFFNTVDQPLKPLLHDTILGKTMEIAAGLREPDSILNCYYDPAKTKAPANLNGIRQKHLP